jgi:hypothetical protein
MTLLTFVVPIRHQDNARDWPGLTARLRQTLGSIANQANPDWRCVIVANEGADLPPVSDKFAVRRVTFPPNDMHELGKAPREAVLDAFRLDKGRRVLAGMLAARDSRFFMIVDDDDLVSCTIVDHVARHSDENGWYVDRGFLWDDGGRWFFRVEQFDGFCGTSLIIRSDLYDLPERQENAAIDWIKDMLGSHVRIKPILAMRGTPLAALPFAGAVYRIGSPGSHSKAPGIWRLKFLQRDILRDPRWFIGNLRRLKRIGTPQRLEFFGKANPP